MVWKALLVGVVTVGGLALTAGFGEAAAVAPGVPGQGAVRIAGEPPRAAAEASTLRLAQAAQPGRSTDGSIITLEPPRVAPFVFAADLSDSRVVLSGYVPDEETRDRFARMGADVTGLEVARGAPEAFADDATAGLALLEKLASGRLAFDGKAWALSGTAASPLAAVNADAAFAASKLADQGWSYAVGLPPAEPGPALATVTPYDFRIERLPAGTIAISGHVPTAGLQQVLERRAGEQVVDTTVLGAGAPEGFAAAALAGLAALQQFEEGALALENGHWSLTAKTGDAAVADAARTALAAAADTAGWTLDIDAPPPPPAVAAPFTFAVAKADDGSYALTGHVVNDGFRRFLAARLGNVSSDRTEVAAGAPEGFVTDALAGLGALARLETGTLAFDGKVWSLAGTPETTADADAAVAALAGASTAAGSWQVALGDPLTPQPAAAPPAADAQASGAVAASEPAAPATGGESPAAEPADPAAAATIATPTEAAGPLPGQVAEPASAPPRADQPAESADAASPAAAPEAPALEVTAAIPEQPAPAAAPVPPAASPETPPLAAPPPAAPAAPPPAAVAAVEAPASTPAPAAATVATPVFSAQRSADGAVTLEGAVPADATAAYLGVVAGGAPIDRLRVASNLPVDFIPNVGAGVHALMHLSTGTLGFDGSHWTLTGTADTEAEREAALSGLTAPGWTTDVALTPPLALCQREVADFSSRNSIRFQSGKAAIAPDSADALQQLASYLAQCPDAVVNVEGYTDSDGPDDLNLALSVDRAEAVVGALVALGVGADRLYAIGYGESLPVASNDTAAGKAANRRIVVSVAPRD